MKPRVLAVSSQGGHWEQLWQLLPAFEEMDTYLVCAGAETQNDRQVRRVVDCNRHTPIRALVCFFQLVRIALTLRPHFVVSTGALPGAIALAVGRMIGARTIWVDSLANAEALSQSGRFVRPVSDLHLTQWPEVSARTGSQYYGSLL
ncbi:glycosyltransferase family protein [Actibacterium pelagium]|uniref:UDP-N-acetylglucosamine--LPS N-acetylglucosamine transferase n=1 Tax=Actibacterium pelagium TaxID=2029103 RepID=UPI000BAAED4E|nr:UDP-N-acetylglucosamine--LPS N-acetylglucosamine transferase [Actibacterium pelagium]